jgi:hypothetical protein
MVALTLGGSKLLFLAPIPTASNADGQICPILSNWQLPLSGFLVFRNRDPEDRCGKRVRVCSPDRKSLASLPMNVSTK